MVRESLVSGERAGGGESVIAWRRRTTIGFCKSLSAYVRALSPCLSMSRIWRTKDAGLPELKSDSSHCRPPLCFAAWAMSVRPFEPTPQQ